mmetsp:Transcript_10592/g.20470  ORF Transcript_10592/g.20470 Transcript_10592/m.20470 type:complete len:234 (-) Transcript_10592:55-756(-)
MGQGRSKETSPSRCRRSSHSDGSTEAPANRPNLQPGNASEHPISNRGAPGEPQYSVEAAVSLQRALLAAFAEESFQKLLKLAEAKHPNRGQRLHPDAQAFAVHLQGLLLHVYQTVLPKAPWCLSPGWEGFRQMNSRMASVAEHPKVLVVKEQILAMLGLPRHAILRAPAEEPLLTETPDGSGCSGASLAFEAALLRDSDGDAAHEFWEEDRSGRLVLVQPRHASAAANAPGSS